MTADEEPRTTRHPVKGFFTLVTGLVLGIGMLLGLTAGIGGIWSSVTSSTGTAAAGSAASGGSANVVDLVIKDVSTPDSSEPAFVGPNGVGAPVLFTATAGTSVTVHVKNEDAMPHTFDAPALGLDVSINADATTTFSFTPKAAGTDSFRCDVPCGVWVMGHAGYMQGSVKVVA